MRLFNVRTLQLQDFGHQVPPPYAIASHRWSGDEADLIDVVTQQNTTTRGYEKVLDFAAFVHKSTTLDWLWIDTICIDRNNSRELHDAINSMFKWYRDSDICIAHLEDVRSQHLFGTRRVPPPMTDFVRSTWFNRGWTLQELLAPTFVLFVTQTWEVIGSKGSPRPCYRGTAQDLRSHIASATKLPVEVLYRYEASLLFNTSQKLAWVADRATTRPEDMSYCMLGVIGVRMPILYGEGEKSARKRLLAAAQNHEQTPKSVDLPHVAVDDLHIERTLLSLEFAQRLSRVQPGVRSSHIVAVVGPCGVGKTQLVSRYLKQHDGSYRSVFWLDVRNKMTMLASVAKFYRALGLHTTTTYPDGFRTEFQPAIRYMLSWLHERKPTEQWVVVFDNVNDNFDISKVIPHGPAGVMILIGRSRAAVARGLSLDQQNDIVQVPMMSMGEAVALLIKVILRRLGLHFSVSVNLTQHELLPRLVGLCDRLPFAVNALGSLLSGKYLDRAEARRELRKILRRAQFDDELPPSFEFAGQILGDQPFQDGSLISQFEIAFERVQQKLFSRDFPETESEFPQSQVDSFADSGYGSFGTSSNGERDSPFLKPSENIGSRLTENDRDETFSIQTDRMNSGSKAREQKVKFSAAFAMRLADCFRDVPKTHISDSKMTVQELRHLLDQYARLLGSTTSKPHESKAAVFVQHHRQ